MVRTSATSTAGAGSLPRARVDLPADAQVRREPEWKGLSKRCYDAVLAHAPDRISELVRRPWFDEPALRMKLEASGDEPRR